MNRWKRKTETTAKSVSEEDLETVKATPIQISTEAVSVKGS